MRTNRGAADLLAARAQREGRPVTVTFQVTDRCNYECVHCYQEHREPGAARREELSAEVFKRRIAELFGFDTDLLTVPGEASMRVNGHILRDSPARRTPRQRAEPPARR